MSNEACDKVLSKTVISGLGVICCGGNNLEEVWSTLEKNEVKCLPGDGDFFAPHLPSPLFSIANKDVLSLCTTLFLNSLQQDALAGINRTIALALKAINEATDQAGVVLHQFSQKRVGIAIGTTVGCTFHNEPYYIEWKKGKPQPLDPMFTYLSSNIAARLQEIMQLRGPRAVITNACASGTDAIGIAKGWLDNDMCDIAIAGGSDEISRIACHGFSSLMLFSQSPCTPFDEKRKGLNLGEGAGIVILEKEASAQKRNTPPLGYLRGYGAASDAHHPTAPHPDGRGLQMAIHAACKESHLTIDDIGYINAHGTGTQANDLAELTALSNLGLSDSNPPQIISSKGATGHTLGAAGGIEAAITLKSLREGRTAGTTGCLKQDERLPLKVLRQGKKEEIQTRIGMSQSLAFGGGNAALILEAIP